MTLTASRMPSSRAPRSPGQGSGVALDLRAVTVRYRDGVADDGAARWVTALDEVSLQADAGSLTAVLGPSGSGKSTLLCVVAGLVAPSAGTVVVGGVSLDGLSETERTRLRRDRVGLVFQQPNLLPSLTALEQLVVTTRLGGASRAARTGAVDRARDLLRRVGLEAQAERRPHQLSGGQRQRVNIARALMSRPDVLLADEPTSALDHERSQGVMALLADVTRDLAVATLVVTHDTETLDAVDRVVTMRDGRLLR